MVSADSAESLLKNIAAINIDERNKTEYVQVCRLLSVLSDTDYLSYPLALKKRERPDFLLECNGQNIGIEATEATHKDYREYMAYAEKSPSKAEESSNVLAVPSIRHGDKLSNKQKNYLHNLNELDDGWVGDTPEKDFMCYVKDSIEDKCTKLANEGFEKFDQNWLLILANPPAWFIEEESLDPQIQGLWPVGYPLCFDRIFIESNSRLIALSFNDLKFFPVKNIWRKAL